MLNEIIENNVNAIVDAFVHKARAYDLPPRDAAHAEVMDALHGYVTSVAAALRTARPEPTPRTDANAKAHGLQRWLLGYDLKSVILEYGVLRSVILEVVEGTGYPLSSRELDEVAQILYSGAADAAVEFTARATQNVNEALATAEAAVRAHEEIVAIVSHDLKNPLNVIQGSAAVLEHVLAADIDAPALALLRSGAARIGRATVRMNRLITDLLDLARIKEGRMDLSVRDEQTSQLLTEAVEQCSPMAEKRSIRVAQEDDAHTTVSCDRDRLMQVFDNVIGNALKFSPPGSNVMVRCQRAGEECTFSVRDEGPGIPADQLPMLFERFWMAPRRDTAVGTGLGLAIAKGIIEAHRGRIWVESVVGQGTSFFFTVPCAAAAS